MESERRNDHATDEGHPKASRRAFPSVQRSSRDGRRADALASHVRSSPIGRCLHLGTMATQGAMFDSTLKPYHASILTPTDAPSSATCASAAEIRLLRIV